MKVVLRPIGFVKNRIRKRGWRNWEKIRSRIILEKKLAEALLGLEEYSHIVVIFWMHKARRGKKAPLKVMPHGLTEAGEKGVFAARTPSRPNPIGLSIARLVKIHRNVLWVDGLDALNSTPVLDIKPYTGHPRDLIYKFKAPKWAFIKK